MVTRVVDRHRKVNFWSDSVLLNGTPTVASAIYIRINEVLIRWTHHDQSETYIY